MDTADTLQSIELGVIYWCVVKISGMQADGCLYHLCKGKSTAKGLHLQDDGQEVPFVEVCGQRIRTDHAFETPDEALDFAIKQGDTLQSGQGGEVVPQAA